MYNTEHVSKGVLKFAPLTMIGNMPRDKTGSAIALKVDATTTVYASGMSQPSELNGCDKFVYVPFFGM